MSGIPAGAGSLLGKRLGKYEILALLALGGTAEIYLARIGGAAGFEKYVVVKCLHDHLADDQDFVKMFLDEARLAAHLDHSNIVQTMELGEHENRYYMVMEFLAGLSLAMVVRRAAERLPGGRLPVPLILNVIAQACSGLHYAHERSVNGKLLNIVHRDISPQNLVISFEGVVKVVDFGIAKAELRETKTRSGTIKGKFAYMSPEQCVAANVDRRTDVFALGVISHELLTGRRLFKRSSPYETYQAVIECNVPPPSKLNVELDPALDEIVLRAVAKDKDQRYPTAEAFGDALQSYLHHRGKSSGPGDVARFFESTFTQEIDEHSARMRELISGRDFAVETGVGWGEDEEEQKRNETVDLSARAKTQLDDERSMALEASDLLDEADDGEMPAEKTRIESNPLELLEQLERAAQAKAQGQSSAPAAGAGPQVGPPAAKKPQMPPSGPLPLPAPPTGPVVTGPPARPSSSRFPMSNLPTQIADDPAAPANARTQIGAQPVDAGHGAPGYPPSRPSAAALPTGYPVMSAQMSEQIARGGDLFPSEPPRVPDSAPRPSLSMIPHSGPVQAANVMSPVGQNYPQQVDWAEAAATPARALPPWAMIALFVGAIGVALVITIIIAKLAT